MEKKMMSGTWFLWMAGLVVLVVVASRSAHAISCSEAITTLLPCQPFLTGAAPSPSVPCCSGVSTLKDEASTTEDRREICQCLNDAAPGFGVIPDKARQLPESCGVSSPVPIDPNIDCQTIPMQRK